MRHALNRFYWKLERLFHPGLRCSQLHYRDMLESAVQQGCDWLDLGCGHQLFASWMAKDEKRLASRSRKLIGIDLDWEGLRKNTIVSGRVYGNLQSLPFEPNTFDLVTANMVVEHLDEPAIVLQQIHRVLRTGGRFIFHTPNFRSLIMRLAAAIPESLKKRMIRILENRKDEDVFVTFYRMNTFDDIRRAAAANGFVVEQLRAVSTSAATGILGPLAIFELLYLKFIERPAHEERRSNLLVVLQKVA